MAIYASVEANHFKTMQYVVAQEQLSKLSSPWSLKTHTGTADTVEYAVRVDGVTMRSRRTGIVEDSALSLRVATCILVL